MGASTEVACRHGLIANPPLHPPESHGRSPCRLEGQPHPARVARAAGYVRVSQQRNVGRHGLGAQEVDGAPTARGACDEDARERRRLSGWEEPEMPERKRPMFSMRAARQSGSPSGTISEVPLDLAVRDVRNNTYLALRAGEDSVLLTECEAEALAVAIRKLSVFASALDNARNFAGKARAEGAGERA